MLGVLRVLIEADQGGGAPEILSTHPDPKRRLKDAEKQINEDYQDDRGELFESRFRKGAEPYLSAPRR